MAEMGAQVVRRRRRVRSASGSLGQISIEVRLDEAGEVVRYNLAFINHEVCRVDHGRVLGYDNAHGFDERHWMGGAEPVQFESYEAVLERFLAEVTAIKEAT